MRCPICRNNSTLIKHIYSGNFDNSVLYDTIKIGSCDNCGHIFNDITKKEIENLNEYYITEYSNCHNNQHTSEIIANVINQKNLNSYLTAVTNFNKNKTIGFVGKYKHIFLEQFIEHIAYPNELFRDITKHLYIDGYLTISCPDALRYLNENVHFPNYNFLIREHIQHFDSTHLIYLANKHGFDLVTTIFNDIEILKGVNMPNIEFTFRYIGNKVNNEIKADFFELRHTIEKEINVEHTSINVNGYCYGIGREFLFMKRNNIITNIIGLIDSTPSKQYYTVDGMKLRSDAVIKDLPKDSTIFIAALAHKDFIKDKLNKLNYRGAII